MMQDYIFTPSNPNTSLDSASTKAQPSVKVVKNILDFARCCQNIGVKDVKLKLFLN